MAAHLWSMPAAAGISSATGSAVRHVPDPGTLALLALGLGQIDLGLSLQSPPGNEDAITVKTM